jgi:succinate dehydrogenase / fumarate reductase, iron-sulfur subunit
MSSDPSGANAGLSLTLHVWRQKDAAAPGAFESYSLRGVSPDASFLEMLDVLNEQLLAEGREPVAFDHDCREGICGSCGMMINGQAHGPDRETATCQLHMRRFRDGDSIHIEPFRAKAFPVLRDLVVDRSAFDRILALGGFVSVNTGSAPEANSVPVAKENAELAMDAAACIGCGACVAACPNAAAMLFVGAKISHLALLPHGQVERSRRVLAMVEQMDREGFGNCSNVYECEAACPKAISVENIGRLNREYLKASLARRPEAAARGGD